MNEMRIKQGEYEPNEDKVSRILWANASFQTLDDEGPSNQLNGSKWPIILIAKISFLPRTKWKTIKLIDQGKTKMHFSLIDNCSVLAHSKKCETFSLFKKDPLLYEKPRSLQMNGLAEIITTSLKAPLYKHCLLHSSPRKNTIMFAQL